MSPSKKLGLSPVSDGFRFQFSSISWITFHHPPGGKLSVKNLRQGRSVLSLPLGISTGMLKDVELEVFSRIDFSIF